jgi:hypothetical protein
MNTSLSAFSFKKSSNAFEWRLLVFLILFMDVKLVIKAAAIVLIYVFQPDFRFGFRLRNSRLPLFYLLAIGITMLNWILYQNFTINYGFAALTGICFWLLCILAIHQVKLIVDRTEINILHNTIRLFFLLNIVVSLASLFIIAGEIGFQNPFRYQGEFQRYFANTGDHIRGIPFDTSTTNALINAFGVVYFMAQRKYVMVIACMAILIITGSNFTNIILALVFLYLFIFNSTREQKSIMVVCMMMLVIFFTKISPENSRYISGSFKKYLSEADTKYIPKVKSLALKDKPGSMLTINERKDRIAALYLDSLERIEQSDPGRLADDGGVQVGAITMYTRPELPTENIHASGFQSRKDTSADQQRLLSFMNSKKQSLGTPYPIVHELPGKAIAFMQAFNFFRQHPQKILTGAGTGNFSSKLAFKATGLNLAGGYPHQFTYISNDFLYNHLWLYCFYFTKNVALHSIINYPASVYGQLFTEYGIAGILALLFFYIGFFGRRYKNLSYGVPLLLIVLSAFMVDYWFEQLSMLVLFELLMFTDIKQNPQPA